jgi:repressor LexA
MDGEKQLSKNESKVFDFIKAYSEKKGYPPTYKEIQEKFEYKAISSVQQYIEQLVGKGHLLAPLGSNKKRGIQLMESHESELVTLKLEGQVAAGRLTEAVQNREDIEVPRYLLRSGSDYFALKVKGDSMIGDCIMDGDVVVIKRQYSATNGQTVVALVEGEATIKRFQKKKTHIELHPANPNYDVIKVSADAEFKILGVLSSVIRQCE